MKNQCTIVMYHYVRELPYTRYPQIKGLLASQFKEQLAYIERYYHFITVEDCINAIYFDVDLPSNAILLTFDDGLIDHYNTVFPILESKGIQGCFFPSAKSILEHEVPDVHKIHFLLASALKIHDLIQALYGCLDKYRSEYSLESNDHYFSKLAKAGPMDTKGVVFMKRMLQSELEETLRSLILDELFRKYVSNDEEAFSRELYMSIDQLQCMNRNGMYIGSHGYDHYFLNTLTAERQEKEIDLSLSFLKEKVGAPTDNWVMCYPYGGYDDSLIEILKKKNCKLALADTSAKADIAGLNKDNAYTLERIDTNDLPKIANAETNSWTKKVLI